MVQTPRGQKFGPAPRGVRSAGCGVRGQEISAGSAGCGVTPRGKPRTPDNHDSNHLHKHYVSNYRFHILLK